jgi:hypothetical protein
MPEYEKDRETTWMKNRPSRQASGLFVELRYLFTPDALRFFDQN